MIKNIVTVKTGSHLYGLARPDSDIDLYTIYVFTHQKYRPKKQALQMIDDESDTLKISWDKFREYVLKGVPQTLEVLFAPEKFWLDWDPKWKNYRAQLAQEMQAHIPTIRETYRRTVINFFHNDDFKKNRHGFRLLVNAEELRHHGRINPTLDIENIRLVNRLALLPWQTRQDEYKDWLFRAFNDL